MRALRMIVIAGALAGLLAACGTPSEVKTLSAAQVTYLQKTSTAVSAQSKALLNLAQAHATVLKAEWNKTEEARLAQFTQAAKSDPSSTGALIQAAAQYGAGWQTRGARLDQVVADLEATSKKLETAMGRLIQVQQALDAYAQSETAGEAFLRRVVKVSDAGTLLDHASAAVAQVASIAGTLDGQLKDITAMGGAQ